MKHDLESLFLTGTLTALPGYGGNMFVEVRSGKYDTRILSPHLKGYFLVELGTQFSDPLTDSRAWTRLQGPPGETHFP